MHGHLTDPEPGCENRPMAKALRRRAFFANVRPSDRQTVRPRRALRAAVDGERRRSAVGQNWEASKSLAAAPETATATSASRIGAPQCPCWRPAGVLLATACAMAWRLAWLCVAVRGCMVMICQWGKDQQRGHTSPLSTCSMTACPDALTIRQRLSVNA